jgi:hypothetical protein
MKRVRKMPLHTAVLAYQRLVKAIRAPELWLNRFPTWWTCWTGIWALVTSTLQGHLDIKVFIPVTQENLHRSVLHLELVNGKCQVHLKETHRSIQLPLNLSYAPFLNLVGEQF